MINHTLKGFFSLTTSLPVEIDKKGQILSSVGEYHTMVFLTTAVLVLQVVKFKKTEKTETVRFDKIFLNNWASKTYINISKKQYCEVLPALYTSGENDKNYVL